MSDKKKAKRARHQSYKPSDDSVDIERCCHSVALEINALAKATDRVATNSLKPLCAGVSVSQLDKTNKILERLADAVEMSNALRMIKLSRTDMLVGGVISIDRDAIFNKSALSAYKGVKRALD